MDALGAEVTPPESPANPTADTLLQATENVRVAAGHLVEALHGTAGLSVRVARLERLAQLVPLIFAFGVVCGVVAGAAVFGAS